jgi:hypothetical protein
MRASTSRSVTALGPSLWPAIMVMVVLGRYQRQCYQRRGPCAVALGNSGEGGFVPLFISFHLLSSIALYIVASISISMPSVASRTRRGPGTANEIGQLLMAHSCNTPAVAIALARRLRAGYSQAARRLDPGLDAANAANAVPKHEHGPRRGAPMIGRRRSPLLPGPPRGLPACPDWTCILHPRSHVSSASMRQST